jgi:hypothetical protein
MPITSERDVLVEHEIVEHLQPGGQRAELGPV